MMNTRARSAGPALGLVLTLAALGAASSAEASTLYACVAKKGGAVRLLAKKGNCRRSERSVSWNSSGPAGTNGTNGAAGAAGGSGAPGEPQGFTRFSGSEAATAGAVPLFSAGGVSYSLECVPIFTSVLEIVKASAPSGKSYGSAADTRPVGEESMPGDPVVGAYVSTLGGAEPQAIAYGGNVAENKAKSREENSVWTVTVEVPGAVTWIHMLIDANTGCSVQGSEITLPG